MCSKVWQLSVRWWLSTVWWLSADSQQNCGRYPPCDCRICHDYPGNTWMMFSGLLPKAPHAANTPAAWSRSPVRPAQPDGCPPGYRCPDIKLTSTFRNGQRHCFRKPIDNLPLIYQTIINVCFKSRDNDKQIHIRLIIYTLESPCIFSLLSQNRENDHLSTTDNF